jgi:hypothetical protein
VPYIGQDLQVAFPSYTNIDDISGSFDGVTTSFPLTVGGVAPVPAPLGSNQCLISVDGVVQRPDDTGTEGFRLSGGNIIFSSAPSIADDFFGIILAGADYVNVGANFPDGTLGAPSITFDQDNDTGYYRSGSGAVSFASNGVAAGTWSSAGVTAPALIPTGSSVPANGVYLPAANTVGVTTNGTQRITIDSGGRLLVGTSSARPSRLGGSNFQTQLQLESDSTSGLATSRFNDATGSSFVSLQKGRGTIASPAAVIANDVTGTILFSGWDGAAFTNSAFIRSEVDGTPGTNDMPGRLVFATTADGASSTTERLRITSAGLVGIGTSAPDRILDIESAGSAEIKLTDSTNIGRDMYIKNNDGAFEFRSRNRNSDGAFVFLGYGGEIDSERMQIDSSGRLLVGTSSSRSVGGNVQSNLQIEGTGTGVNTTSCSVTQNSNTADGPRFMLAKSRSASNGGVTVVQSGDSLGIIDFAGADGTDASSSAVRIRAEVDGTPGANDMPGRIILATTADGASTPTERMRIDSAGRVGIGTTSPDAELDVNGRIYLAEGNELAWHNGAGAQAARIYGSSTDELRFDIGSTASRALTIDSSGRLLVGTSTDRFTTKILVESTDGTSGITTARASNDSSPPYSFFIKSRGATVGSNTVVQSGDVLGFIGFYGTDGTAPVSGASINAAVDGTPGTNDMPGRLVFSTTADGASSPTERMRISSAGKLTVPGVYNGTTSGGSAVYVEADGDLLRFTSSRKYKTDIETIEDEKADAILECRPVWYRSLSQNDIKTEGATKSDWGWYGFIAEEVAEIDPRLVSWATKDAVSQEDGSLKSIERDPVDYEAEGVRYDNFVPLLLNLIKRQKEQIEAMEARLTALETA